jgi:hypothetical protein
VQLTQLERRTFKRLHFTSHVVITHNGYEQKVRCKDVNNEGMSLYLTNNHLKLHDEVLVQFDDHDAYFPALNADADVIRVQPLANGFLIALEFVVIY